MNLLELEDVNTLYGQSHILHGVSLSIEKDSLVSLIGRNGAGKTTTLSSIMGIVQPTTGEIRLDGMDMVGMEPNEISRLGIALVPEHRRVFPELTVKENLALGHMGHDIDDGQVEDLYERAFDYFPRVEERLEQRAGNMSGGEQQMLAIARGLISNPDLLLIDEPTEGLMPTLVDKLRDILVQMNEDGITILLVEQNVEMALNISDYGYVIDEGVIQASGSSEELQRDEEVKKRYLALG